MSVRERGDGEGLAGEVTDGDLPERMGSRGGSARRDEGEMVGGTAARAWHSGRLGMSAWMRGYAIGVGLMLRRRRLL